MNKRLLLFTLFLSLGGAGICWSAGAQQQSGAAPATAAERATMEAYRLKAERVQSLRKARITQQQREVAAERSKLDRGKAPQDDKAAKGGAK